MLLDWNVKTKLCYKGITTYFSNYFYNPEKNSTVGDIHCDSVNISYFYYILSSRNIKLLYVLNSKYGFYGTFNIFNIGLFEIYLLHITFISKR